MNDKELLELAAKAAGINNAGHTLRGIGTAKNGACLIGIWNPLTDDGDALRLAVKLPMLIDTQCRSVMNTSGGRESRGWFSADDSKDFCSNMRRAIVMAAAEIGKSM